MVFPDIRNLGEVIFNGLLYSSATFATHPHDEASATAPAHEPLLYARAVVTSSSMCAASLPKSCSYLDTKLSILLLATIPYVCMADIKTLSPTLYTTVQKSCPLNYLQPGSKLLACLKSGLLTAPVSTTCSKASTSYVTPQSTGRAETTLSTRSVSKSSTRSAYAAASSSASSSHGSKFSSPSSRSHSQSSTKASSPAVASEAVNSTNYMHDGARPVAQTNVIVDGTEILTNTSVAANTTVIVDGDVTGTSTSSTILVIARDVASSYSAYSGLNGYGIPFEVLLVPQNGTTLPILNSSVLVGNYGGIVILSEVSYDYGTLGGGFQSALTQTQWLSLYQYQQSFGVRMVRMDVFPSADSGTLAQGGCCGTGVEQLVSISDTTQFPTAGLNIGATMSTIGLYHYPATITNSTIATPFVEFAPTTGFPTTSTAGVINNISGRQQMVFFMSFATNWSPTSNLLQHAWIHWVTRGLYVGFRRTYLGTQVDDMFLESDIYYPGNNTFRIRTTDMDAIKTWIPTINTKMNKGSSYFMEIGHNGNGNIGAANSLDTTGTLCSGGSVLCESVNSTSLEFQKALGSGTNAWPATPTDYPYSVACTNGDPLKVWLTTPENRDVFAHVSHTFTHQGQNNATYSDIFNEISWNVAWLKQVGFSSAKYFSPNGLIPPAITGLHNGDALSAWAKNGITNAVGDNTRPVLMNKINEHWPLITTVAANGFDGMQITPRWATNIYYNCDTADCTVQEWIMTSAGNGTIIDLLNIERVTTSRHLLGLHHDPFMFHQANLRQVDVSSTIVNGESQQLSLIQMWVETVVVEMSRIVNWPLISIKHDDISAAFAQRMARDACKPKMTYQIDLMKQAITGVQVTTLGNTCSVSIPVTLPGSVTNTQGFTTEQVGNDPLTIWVKMSGSAVKFTLTTPVPW